MPFRVKLSLIKRFEHLYNHRRMIAGNIAQFLKKLFVNCQNLLRGFNFTGKMFMYEETTNPTIDLIGKELKATVETKIFKAF